jgi:hypothetical protein
LLLRFLRINCLRKIGLCKAMRRHHLQRNDAYSNSNDSTQKEHACGDEEFESDLIKMRFRGYLAITKVPEPRSPPTLRWRTKKSVVTNEKARFPLIKNPDRQSSYAAATADEVSKLTDEWSRIYLILSTSSSRVQMPSPKIAHRQQVWPRTCVQDKSDNTPVVPLQEGDSALSQHPPYAADEWATCFLPLIE